MSFAPDTETFAKPQALLLVPVGLASPLWGLFAGAAMTGATWWWMTRWTRPQNLEAMFGAAAEAGADVEGADVEQEMAAIAAPVVEAVEPVVEAAPGPVAEATPEPAMEAVVEAAPELVAETLVEASVALEPVALEPAPEPILEVPVAESLAPALAEAPMEVEPGAEAAAEPETTPQPKRKKAGSPSASDTSA